MKKHTLLLISAAFVLAAVFTVFKIADSPRYSDSIAATVIHTAQSTLPERSMGLVNLNTASIEELMTLSEIGEKKAQAIIDYREECGRFMSVDELTNVSGIGSSILEMNRDRLTV